VQGGGVGKRVQAEEEGEGGAVWEERGVNSTRVL